MSDHDDHHDLPDADARPNADAVLGGDAGSGANLGAGDDANAPLGGDAGRSIGESIRRTSAAVPVGDPTAVLGQVRENARRRGRRRTALLGVAAVAALAVGGAVVANVVGDDDRGDDLLLSTPGTTEPTDDTSEAGDADGSEAADDAPVATDVPAAEAPASTAVAEVDAAEGAVAEFPGTYLVPWRDGFLQFGTNYAPQPLPTELPDEVVALFPPEVQELFAEGLPPTIDEATSMLSEAGLLDEVTAVLSEHPEANEAIYATPAPTPEFVARFTVDGQEWADVDLVAPADAWNVNQVVSTGERLIVITTEYAEPPAEVSRAPQTAAVRVLSTTDLVTWDEVRIDQPVDPGLPDYVTSELWVESFAATSTGWVAGVNRFVSVDSWSRIPFEELQAELGDGYENVGGEEDDDGVTVTFTNRDHSDEVRYEFTWAELGIDPAVVEQYRSQGPGDSVELLSARWGGEVTTTPTEGYGTLAPFGQGFLRFGATIEFSPDGAAWIELTAPTDAGRPLGALEVGDDAVVLFGSEGAGPLEAWRLAADGTWSAVELPALPDDAFPFTSPSGSAMLLQRLEYEPAPPQTVNVPAGEYVLELTTGPTISYLVADAATGAVLVTEETGAGGGALSFEHLEFADDGDITITDPASGEVLVEISSEDIDRAFQEQAPPVTDAVVDEGPPPAPEAWVLATVDGTSWLFEPLSTYTDSTIYDGPLNVTTNGSRVAIATFDDLVVIQL